jgi:hypothetical protein
MKTPTRRPSIVVPALIGGITLICVVGALTGQFRPSGRAPAAAQPPAETSVPPTSAPTIAPSATPDARAQLLEAVRDMPPAVFRGAPSIEYTDFGAGPRAVITIPIGDQGTPEQIVRLGKLRIAGAMKAAFEGLPELAEVNVIGTTPLAESEAPAISLLVSREEFAAWGGDPDRLPGWQVGGRLE